MDFESKIPFIVGILVIQQRQLHPELNLLRLMDEKPIGTHCPEFPALLGKKLLQPMKQNVISRPHAKRIRSFDAFNLISLKFIRKLLLFPNTTKLLDVCYKEIILCRKQLTSPPKTLDAYKQWNQNFLEHLSLKV